MEKHLQIYKMKLVNLIKEEPKDKEAIRELKIIELQIKELS